MPNWCFNKVTVTGDRVEVSKFTDFVKSDMEPFSFDSIIPMPKELLQVQSPTILMDTEAEVETYKEEHKKNSFQISGYPITKDTQNRLLKEHGFDNWYMWSCENWGVKWEIRECTLTEIDTDELEYIFDTPWGPPEPICEVLREKFPDLSITWFWDEPGMEMAGYL